MDSKLKKGLIFNSVFAGIIVFTALLYMILLPYCNQYIIKSIPSVLFVICGLFNLIFCLKNYKQDKVSLKYSIILVVGLFFAMLGDILLIDFFPVGAGLFAIGHIFFFISFCFINKVVVRDFIIALLIFGVSLLVIEFYPFDFKGMKLLVIIYALIISLMLGKAISNFVSGERNLLRLAILIGASLFFFSDLMLLFHNFAHHVTIFDWLCVMTYYPAEFILAFGIFIANTNLTFNRLK